MNHRHLDLQVRLPRTLLRFEPELRRRLQGRFARGKVEVTCDGPGRAPPSETLRIDAAVAARYVRAARELGDAPRPRPSSSTSSGSSRCPGVARLAEPELSRGGARRRARGGGRARRRRARGDAPRAKGRRSRGSSRARLAPRRRARRAGSPASAGHACRPRPASGSASAPSSSPPRPASATRRASPRSWSGPRTASTSPRSWCGCAATPTSSARRSPGRRTGGVGRRLEFLLQEMAARGEHRGLEGGRRARRPSRGGAEDGARAHPRAGAECRVGRSRGAREPPRRRRRPPHAEHRLREPRHRGPGDRDRLAAVVAHEAPARGGRRAAASSCDATQGRRTRSILVTDSDHVILSAINPETIAARLEQGEEGEGEA